MGKLIISRDANVLQTVQLTKERMTIGRQRHNDIVLHHPTVSGEHAVIVTILDDSFLEDLSSTNGTFVNGHRVGKHFLQNKDMITLSKFRLEFIADGLRPFTATAGATAPASIEVLNGANAGKRLILNKPETTLGRPGVQVIIIIRTVEGYTISHVEGEQVPLLNSTAIERAPRALRNGDVIDLAGTMMMFSMN